MTPENSDDAIRRAERRAFVRAHHPDAGGDPEVFAAGLAALTGSVPARPRVHVVRRAGLRARMWSRIAPGRHQHTTRWRNLS